MNALQMMKTEEETAHAYRAPHEFKVAHLEEGSALAFALESLGYRAVCVPVERDGVSFHVLSIPSYQATPDEFLRAVQLARDVEAVKAADIEEMPDEFKAAIFGLLESATDEESISRRFDNDTATTYHAVAAALRLGRAMLERIEETALDALRREQSSHRAALQSIEALGVL